MNSHGEDITAALKEQRESYKLHHKCILTPMSAQPYLKTARAPAPIPRIPGVDTKKSEEERARSREKKERKQEKKRGKKEGKPGKREREEARTPGAAKRHLVPGDPWTIYRDSKGPIYKSTGKGPCFDFQTVAGCSRDTCVFEHICGKCGGNHSFTSGSC